MAAECCPYDPGIERRNGISQMGELEVGAHFLAKGVVEFYLIKFAFLWN